MKEDLIEKPPRFFSNKEVTILWREGLITRGQALKMLGIKDEISPVHANAYVTGGVN